MNAYPDISIQNTLDKREFILNYDHVEILFDKIISPLTKYKIVISNDPTSSTFHQFKENQKIAGVATQYYSDSGLITIYLDSSLTNDEQTFEINRMFVKGLFFLDKETQISTTGEIDYQEISLEANHAFMRAVEENALPIQITIQ